MDELTIGEIVSWLGGILSFLAIGAIAVVAIREVFLGKPIAPETALPKPAVPEAAAPEELAPAPQIPDAAKKKAAGKKSLLPYILPAAIGFSYYFIAIIAVLLRGGETFDLPYGSILTLFGDNKFFSGVNIGISILSIFFFFCGSLLVNKMYGERAALLYCLNPFGVFFALPVVHSAAAFLVVKIIDSFKKNDWITLAICAALVITIQIPVKKANITELLCLAYVVVICMAGKSILKTQKRKFEVIAMTLAMLSGALTALFMSVWYVL